MPNDEDWRRRREREDEEEREEALRKKGADYFSTSEGVPPEKVDEFLQRAAVLIDQLNNLYNMYLSGAEKLPPTEKRKQLDQIMVTLTYTGKPTPSLQFRCNGMVSRYATHKERWDRIIKDLESGKVKRVTGPKISTLKRTA